MAATARTGKPSLEYKNIPPPVSALSFRKRLLVIMVISSYVVYSPNSICHGAMVAVPIAV
jgi:hypothetical protein